MALRSWRHEVVTVTVDGRAFEVARASLLVVLRDGDTEPGATDWELTLLTDPPRRLAPGRHDLSLATVGGTRVRGPAVVRYSDGSQHLLRGDGTLEGAAALLG